MIVSLFFLLCCDGWIVLDELLVLVLLRFDGYLLHVDELCLLGLRRFLFGLLIDVKGLKLFLDCLIRLLFGDCIVFCDRVDRLIALDLARKVVLLHFVICLMILINY